MIEKIEPKKTKSLKNDKEICMREICTVEPMRPKATVWPSRYRWGKLTVCTLPGRWGKYLLTWAKTRSVFKLCYRNDLRDPGTSTNSLGKCHYFRPKTGLRSSNWWNKKRAKVQTRLTITHRDNERQWRHSSFTSESEAKRNELCFVKDD